MVVQVVCYSLLGLLYSLEAGEGLGGGRERGGLLGSPACILLAYLVQVRTALQSGY